MVSGGPGVANRCLTLLSKMFNLAERWGWRAEGSNPVRHVERCNENKRERYLSAEELARLGEALASAEREWNSLAICSCRNTPAALHRGPPFGGAYA